MSHAQHPDDGLILRRAQVLAPAMSARKILDWINDRPELYLGTIDEAVLAACAAFSDAKVLSHYSPREQEVIRHALDYGCYWHGLLPSDGCAECGMIRFYREEVGREADEE